MTTCKARTATGQPCRMQALKGSRYCFTHSPDHGHQRAQARRHGGERQRVPHAGNTADLPTQIRTIADANRILSYVLAEALPLENSIARGRLLLAIHDSFVNALRTVELEARLIALENALATREAQKAREDG